MVRLKGAAWIALVARPYGLGDREADEEDDRVRRYDGVRHSQAAMKFPDRIQEVAER